MERKDNKVTLNGIEFPIKGVSYDEYVDTTIVYNKDTSLFEFLMWDNNDYVVKNLTEGQMLNYLQTGVTNN